MLFETFWTQYGGMGDENLPDKRCEKCEHYHMIDSAYGYCLRFPPKNIIVKLIPFRRDYEYPVVTWHLPACAEYKERKK